jgi:hypothetical protein
MSLAQVVQEIKKLQKEDWFKKEINKFIEDTT